MFKKAKENKKGFTLAELLIVVAIIAVLIMVMFGALAGIIPAKRAINIKPIDAIREE